MPEIFIDDKNFELYKQCEIRRPSGKPFTTWPGYYYDILWIKADLARKGNIIKDERGDDYTIHEVYGSKRMPGSRGSFKQVKVG